MRTVVGLFTDTSEARGSLQDFARLGLSSGQIGVLAPAESATSGMSLLELRGIGPVAANRPMLTLLRSQHGIAPALTKIGVSRKDLGRCIDSIRRGGTLEAVTVDDAKEAEALAIMRRHTARERTNVEDSPELVIPIVAEELVIGTREVDAGGVRVSTHVRDVPVEKTVIVREERVTIERRIVDRPIDGEDAYRDRSVDVTARTEEPVVSKRGRLVGEIRVHKDCGDRVETVHDNLRRTEVEVTDLPASARERREP
jgi:stress response protein YsnF